MNMPGFTGEASLYMTGGQYRSLAIRAGRRRDNEVVAAMYACGGCSTNSLTYDPLTNTECHHGTQTCIGNCRTVTIDGVQSTMCDSYTTKCGHCTTTVHW